MNTTPEIDELERLRRIAMSAQDEYCHAVERAYVAEQAFTLAYRAEAAAAETTIALRAGYMKSLRTDPQYAMMKADIAFLDATEKLAIAKKARDEAWEAREKATRKAHETFTAWGELERSRHAAAPARPIWNQYAKTKPEDRQLVLIATRKGGVEPVLYRYFSSLGILQAQHDLNVVLHGEALFWAPAPKFTPLTLPNPDGYGGDIPVGTTTYYCEGD